MSSQLQDPSRHNSAVSTGPCFCCGDAHPREVRKPVGPSEGAAGGYKGAQNSPDPKLCVKHIFL